MSLRDFERRHRTSTGAGRACSRVAAALGYLALFTWALTACAAGPSEVGAAKSVPPKTPGSSEAEQKLGIQVVALRLSEAGNVLDLRYRVVDPEKAHQCLGRGVKPRIEDSRTGLTLSVPDMAYVGSLRQTAVAPEAGKVYFILFGNAGTAVKAGSRVTLVIGDIRLENLVVE